jgi:hypothetical protein
VFLLEYEEEERGADEEKEREEEDAYLLGAHAAAAEVVAVFGLEDLVAPDRFGAAVLAGHSVCLSLSLSRCVCVWFLVEHFG